LSPKHRGSKTITASSTSPNPSRTAHKASATVFARELRCRDGVLAWTMPSRPQLSVLSGRAAGRRLAELASVTHPQAPRSSSEFRRHHNYARVFGTHRGSGARRVAYLDRNPGGAACRLRCLRSRRRSLRVFRAVRAPAQYAPIQKLAYATFN
jgi:hypothetical protein